MGIKRNNPRIWVGFIKSEKAPKLEEKFSSKCPYRTAFSIDGLVYCEWCGPRNHQTPSPKNRWRNGLSKIVLSYQQAAATNWRRNRWPGVWLNPNAKRSFPDRTPTQSTNAFGSIPGWTTNRISAFTRCRSANKQHEDLGRFPRNPAIGPHRTAYHGCGTPFSNKDRTSTMEIDSLLANRILSLQLSNLRLTSRVAKWINH